VDLTYVPLAELERIRSLDAPAGARVALFADACRVNTLTMIEEAGSGHVGTSFSCLDILSWLHLEVLEDGDRAFSSKGHDAPAVYSVLLGTGALPFDDLFRLRRAGGLPGHPDVRVTPQVFTNTGSLGMGVSKAHGFVLADRLAGRRGRVFVLTGDGELQEGQFWESLGPTANRGLGEITVVVDHNKLQSDTWVDLVSGLGDLEAKVAEFGWAVRRCDGNDVEAFASTLSELLEAEPDRPKLIVADTRKGAGVGFIEPGALPLDEAALYAFHSGAPSPEDYARALEELLARLDDRLRALDAAPLAVETRARSPRPAAPRQPQRLVAAYGDALVEAASREPRLVALDGDLRLDTGLVEFQKRFPERFFECGIAEQDMVSKAGTMALGGLLPVCHSFASFLVARAAEQIFTATTEGTKVIYHGSLAGVVPGGPGHSHQMVRDIALMGSVPGMALIEPYCDDEARRAVAWAVHDADGPVYVRLVSPPVELGFDPPAAELVPGRGTVLRLGSRGTFVCTGPILVAQAWAACEELGDWALVALPWLRDIDGAWLAEAAPAGPIVTIDNHVLWGGQGDAVVSALLEAAPERAARVAKVGVDTIPASGDAADVLRAHGLDAASLAAFARAR
jgi:transketolase